jgi:hypothetical protein
MSRQPHGGVRDDDDDDEAGDGYVDAEDGNGNGRYNGGGGGRSPLHGGGAYGGYGGRSPLHHAAAGGAGVKDKYFGFALPKVRTVRSLPGEITPPYPSIAFAY